MRHAPPAHALQVPSQINVNKTERTYPESDSLRLPGAQTSTSRKTAMAPQLTTYFKILDYIQKAPQHRIVGPTVEAICQELVDRLGVRHNVVKPQLAQLQRDGYLEITKTAQGIAMLVTHKGASNVAAARAKEESRAPSSIKARPPRVRVEPYERQWAKQLVAYVRNEGGVIVGSDLVSSVVMKLLSHLGYDMALMLCRHMASDGLIAYRMVKGKLRGLCLPDRADELNQQIDHT
jgi:hypothetical protein